MTATIRARNLSRRFGQTRALDGIDLDIPSGRIVGLIGPNGAGKTTALKAILGLGRYDGELEVLGLDPSKSRDRLMQDVCFIADVAVLPRWARVKHVIELTERLHPRFFARALHALPEKHQGAPGRQGQGTFQRYGGSAASCPGHGHRCQAAGTG